MKEPRLLNEWQSANDDSPLSKNAEAMMVKPEKYAIGGKRNGWKYNNGSYIMAYHKNDKEWIIVTDDGGFYKVDAKYSMWTNEGMHCAWSYKHLVKMIEAKMQGLEMPMDPDYQS